MDEERCPRCGAKLRSLAEIEELARDFAEEMPELAPAERKTAALRIAKRIACLARTCKPAHHPQLWWIYRSKA